MDSNILNQLIEKKHIEDVDLSNIDVNGRDFSNCKLINVVFSTEKQNNRLISNVDFTNSELIAVNFCDAQLNNVCFDHAKLSSCTFQPSKHKIIDNPTLYKVSFRKSKLNNCRFRNTSIQYNDFRYAEILDSTFEKSRIELCDFYRTKFIGYNIFHNSKIKDSSISTFFEGSTIRKSNIANEKILQQDHSMYEKFLQWHQERMNDRDEKAKFNIPEYLNARHEHAENIYRELNGLWNSKGYFADANWAYIQARRMERKRLQYERTNEKRIYRKTKLFILGGWNWFIDFAFGYGESIYKIIRTYILVILLFSFLLYYIVPLDSLFHSLTCSFLTMIAQTPEEIKSDSFIITMLSVVQSSFGILLTGIFGFIIANKIRNQ